MGSQTQDEVKQDERHWQDRQGGFLQQQAYQRSGTQVVIHGQFARIAGALQITPRMRVLDVGCGTGHLLAWLSQREPASYYGIDVSLNSLLCVQQSGPVPDVTVGDAETLPFKKGAFDRVVCNGAAHHFLNLDVALREIYRVLAPGGRIVLYEPAATALTSSVRRLLLRTNKYESPADLAVKEEFSLPRLQALLLETGFTETSHSFHDFLAYPLSGYYIQSPLSRSRALMEFFWRIEGRLERWTFVKPVFDLFAWRLLVVATRPGSPANG